MPLLCSVFLALSCLSPVIDVTMLELPFCFLRFTPPRGGGGGGPFLLGMFAGSTDYTTNFWLLCLECCVQEMKLVKKITPEKCNRNKPTYVRKIKMLKIKKIIFFSFQTSHTAQYHIHHSIKYLLAKLHPPHHSFCSRSLSPASLAIARASSISCEVPCINSLA